MMGVGFLAVLSFQGQTEESERDGRREEKWGKVSNSPTTGFACIYKQPRTRRVFAFEILLFCMHL